MGASGVVLGSLAAIVCLAVLLQGDTNTAEATVPPPQAEPVSAAANQEGTPAPPEVSVSAAMRYAQAVQNGDADEMMRTVVWVAERMERIALDTADADGRKAAQERLAQHLLERKVEGNQLRPEGIEDQYVFAPGATLEWVAVDDGRDDLERPAKERTWIRVTFPSPIRAPVGRSGQAIRSMLVGVNMDENERVLKAGIIGNLDIDTKAIEYWTSPQGG